MPEYGHIDPALASNPWLADHPMADTYLRQTSAAQDGAHSFGSIGRYELSEGQMESLISRLDALAIKIYKSTRSAEPMRQVEPPGEDPHSKEIAPVMNSSGDTYIRSLDSQFHAVNSLREQIQLALDQYRGVEGDTAISLRQASEHTDDGEL